MRTSEGASDQSFTETARTFPSMLCSCQEVASSGNASPPPPLETEGNLGRWGRNPSAAGQGSCWCGPGLGESGPAHLPWRVDDHLRQTPWAAQKLNPRSTVFTCYCPAGNGHRHSHRETEGERELLHVAKLGVGEEKRLGVKARVPAPGPTAGRQPRRG